MDTRQARRERSKADRPMTKTAACPGCCPTGGAIFEADGRYVYENDDDNARRWENIWRCANCHHEMPRRVVARGTRTEMTPSQERFIERRLRLWAEMGDAVQDGTVQFSGRTVIWFGRVGPVDRRGALSLCDRSFFFHIGPRGADRPV